MLVLRGVHGPVLTQKFNRTGKYYFLLILPGPNREPVQTEPVLFGSVF